MASGILRILGITQNIRITAMISGTVIIRDNAKH